MPATAIIGAQWGDEGKGKVVDLLSAEASAIARYAGGPNAGHTLVVGGDKLVFRLVPSGVLHPHTECLLGQGMVLSADVLLDEIATLGARGLALDGRLWVSAQAHLILPYHVLVDTLRETRGAGTHIGTTKRGIGPCYEDKVGRRGLRLGDLADPARTERIVEQAIAAWAPTITHLGGQVPTVAATLEPLASQAERLLPLLADVSARLETRLAAGDDVLLEGAQGTMLDIDHGTYPYVTSSSAIAGGICTGLGIGPSAITRVLGVSKAYATRVGEGPFPTELTGEQGAFLRNAGAEFGSVTGRPRRTGWLDVAALRYARRVNGLQGLLLTKLDVLTGVDTLQLCVGYDTPRGRTDSLPVAHLDEASPVYEQLPGWADDITACRELGALPSAARAYLDRIEALTELPIELVSVGPEREATIRVG